MLHHIFVHAILSDGPGATLVTTHAQYLIMFSYLQRTFDSLLDALFPLTLLFIQTIVL